MTFDDYQKKTHTTALFKEQIWKKLEPIAEHNSRPADTLKKLREIEKLLSLSYLSNGLGESGEVQGKVKKIIRDDDGELKQEKIDTIIGELGDQLWYISEMCTELGVSLDDVAEENIAKLASRKERGVIQGSGDNR